MLSKQKVNNIEIKREIGGFAKRDFLWILQPLLVALLPTISTLLSTLLNKRN